MFEQSLKDLRGDIKAYVSRTEKTTSEIQAQVDAIDARSQGHAVSRGRTFADELRDNESLQQLMRDRKGTACFSLKGAHVAELFERKTTITNTIVGTQTTGVLPIDRIPGVTPEARQALRVRDVLSASPTTMALIDFVKVNSPLSIASPQVEASTKAENALTFTSVSEKVKTIATWIPASRQILDDFAELRRFLEVGLSYYVNLEEEIQLLSGDGTGENLHGLITQATGFNAALLSSSQGWNKIDIVGRAIQQITAAKEIQPTFAIVHPTDWWGMRLQKDSFGRYILGDPQTTVRENLFNLTVVPTTSIATGTFLVGSGNPIASEIRDRMELVVEISTQHQDFFVKNLVCIRAELRVALVVKRPASYIAGSFSQSPA